MSNPEAMQLLRRVSPAIAFVADGSTFAVGDGPPAATVVFRTVDALHRLVACPSLLAFGEAFIEGDIDIEGDLESALEAAYAADALVPVAMRPAMSHLADEDAIRFHYDVSNEFFSLFLDRRMVYTCAYFPNPAADLDAAQAAKLDLVCRKLRLHPG